MTNLSMGSVDTVVLTSWQVWPGTVTAETTWSLIRLVHTISSAITHQPRVQTLLAATLEHVRGAFHLAA